MTGKGITVLQVDEVRRLHDARIRSREIADLTGIPIRKINDVLAERETGRPLSPREQADLDARAGWRAACMDDLEWAEWQRTNPLHLNETAAAGRPCTDCPLGFAADMRAIGRCNGEPGGIQDDAGEPATEEDHVEPRTPIEAVGRRVDVALELPCGRCEKIDVCAIRPTLEAVRSLAVKAPELDSRIDLQLAGEVTCSAFVRARIRKADVAELEGSPRKNRLSPEGLEAMRENGRRRAERNAAERQAVAS